MSVAAPQRLVCRFCGHEFKLSARTIRETIRPGEKPVCRSCRYRQRWWLESSGLTVEELLELGDLLGWR